MSKAKGSEFERKIAGIMNKAFIEHTGLDKAFIRNIHSGAWYGGKNAHRAEGVGDKDLNTGDITTPLDFIYTIECKHYKSPPAFKGFIDGKVSQWDTWIDQTEQDSATSGRSSMLIIKYNLVSEIAMIRKDDSALLKDKKLNPIQPLFLFESKNHGTWYAYNFNRLIAETHISSWFNINLD